MTVSLVGVETVSRADMFMTPPLCAKNVTEVDAYISTVSVVSEERSNSEPAPSTSKRVMFPVRFQV